MRLLKSIIIFILSAILLTACAHSTNTKPVDSSHQPIPQSSESGTTTAPSSEGDSNTSTNQQALPEVIDLKIADEIKSGRLGFGDVKIGDPIERAISILKPLQIGYEMTYENYYCIPVYDGYILYYLDTDNEKRIGGFIYTGSTYFNDKGIDLGNSQTDDVQKTFKKPDTEMEGKWTELFDYDDDNIKERKEFKYKIGSYDLYFDFSDNHIVRIVYKVDAPASINQPDIIKRFQINSLKVLLNEQGQIQIFKYSSGNDVIYTVKDENFGDNVYLWREKDEKPIKIQPLSKEISFVGTTVIWSPDGKYSVLDCGTDVSRINYVVSTEDSKVIFSMRNYLSRPLWAPDSSKIIFTPPSNVKLKVDIGDGGTNDVAFYDINTGETTILEKGTADYLFNIQNISGDVLTCIKEYPETGKQEKVNIVLE